jgi:hypothetical protein
MQKDKLTLKPYEAHFAALCVAIISGASGSCMVIVLTQYNAMQLIYGLILVCIVGFCVSWIVCKYLFPSAHKWYGHLTFLHRIYDIVSITSAALLYYIYATNNL